MSLVLSLLRKQSPCLITLCLLLIQRCLQPQHVFRPPQDQMEDMLSHLRYVLPPGQVRQEPSGGRITCHSPFRKFCPRQQGTGEADIGASGWSPFQPPPAGPWVEANQTLPLLWVFAEPPCRAHSCFRVTFKLSHRVYFFPLNLHTTNSLVCPQQHEHRQSLN